jgi:uncharacterized protein with FMN-binding domain
MKRAPIVISATVAGLAGVLAFHTTPAKVSLGALPAADGGQPASSTGPRASSTGRAASSGQRPLSGRPAATAKPASPAAGTGGGTRSAVGSGVSYSYGVVSVKVTVSGTKILNVGIASIDDGGNPRSESIDQQAIPILEQEAMQAQSANIQGVSGASYTSAGFTQSLQSALHSLGFQ